MNAFQFPLGTATQLFAAARGAAASVSLAADSGHAAEHVASERCFFCGGECAPVVRSKDFVKSSFTGLDSVVGGDWVCGGCVDAMAESTTIRLADGSVRDGQMVRGYSWVVAGSVGGAVACTKAHREFLARACVEPPDPPFVVSISDSGQKHLLYRAVVCHSKTLVTVTLEGRRITYAPADLANRMRLCAGIAAATGKPALVEGFGTAQKMRVVEHFGIVHGEAWLSAWLAAASEPLTSLAAWLCPPKEECLVQFPDQSATTSEHARTARSPARSSDGDGDERRPGVDSAAAPVRRGKRRGAEATLGLFD